MQHQIRFLPQDISISIDEGVTLLQAQIQAGLRPDAPCGGKGSCGKCRVVIDGEEKLACQTLADRDMTVYTSSAAKASILTDGMQVEFTVDGADDYVLAYDIGTTTVVAYLLDGRNGRLLAQQSCMNPQGQYGADVITRIQHAVQGNLSDLSGCIREVMRELAARLCEQAGISGDAVTVAAIVGNTAMHHLLLDIDPKPLITPPYMPHTFEALELGEGCRARILPNIAGFVGGDTVGCMVATRFDQLDELSLLIDIGTNGEMVLGNRERRIACSTAAGPAFEGAKISCGMRGMDGSVDHVELKDGQISYHVIGEDAPKGLCGSGLLDLVAVLLDAEVIDDYGAMEKKEFRLCENVVLTQKDVREVQLAKAAIRTGIELMAEKMGVQVDEIQRVYLAGAFGNYMNPASACRIGMIPPVLLERIIPIGNAAGEGAKLCALSRKEFDYSRKLAKETEFMELASLPNFQDCYVDSLGFSEEEL